VTRNLQNLFVFLVYLISFSLVALGQDTSYSTDSLMAAFSKGSQASLKGAEITVTGVVAEIKKSRVVFKSLGNDKVICELVSSIAIGEHPVGSSLTVAGKVRGRGMLGNVTLDQCNLASSNMASTEPTTIGPSVEPEQPIAEVEETTPPVVADEVPTKSILPTGPAQPRKTVPVAAPNEAVSPKEHVPSNPSITAFEQPNEVVQENSHSLKTVSRGIFRATLAVLLGIGAALAFVKLRLAIAAGLRPPTFPTTDAMRRAALEALLSKEKKQKLKDKARS
jgi:hypothetical protein